MAEISDSLRLLYETQLEKHDDRYVIPVPNAVVDDSSLTTDDVYRVALLAAQPDTQAAAPAESALEGGQSPEQPENGDPPVEVGDVRSVTIETLGDQGDGIAKVERGFIVIVPGTQPGDQADVEITDVKESVAFAELLHEPEAR
ncbi:TRAM domain-containing protein [Halorussus marinus]|uniref:TRAM domain-containing protein n=1 Tax=Halorussus marinus TaxID=2505976 RepID=UPI001091B7D8|nr:TRAM domain-containing protein [Halorussus marinus]